MKKILITIICCISIILCYLKLNTITDFIANKIITRNEIVLPNSNNYVKEYSENYVQEVSEFVPYSYQDLKNILYTSINNGWTNFTFYCPSEYSECVNDITKLSDDDKSLTYINNFVHPYNSFTNLKTTISDRGEVSLDISYLYTEEQMNKINDKINELTKELITDSSISDYDKIKIIHDYIINNTKYDVERNEKGNSKYTSYIAIGPLFDGYATCNGYTDVMALFLTKLNIDNFKVVTTPEEVTDTSTGHVWNAVKLDGKWLHLDLTWDDPVSNDGKDYLYHTYFLVTTEEMKKADSGEVVMQEHNFDQSIYPELKETSN
jgi:hypothetical protein